LQFDPPKVWDNVDIVINGGETVEVGQGAASNYKADKVIDGSGKLTYPGLVCSHHHYYSGLSRGVLAEIGPTPDFVSTLKNLWWRMDRALDEESTYYSSVISSIDAIKAGTTAVIDHHASPSYIRGSLSTIKRGFEDSGLRGMTCYEVTDRNGPDQMREGVEENIRFAKEIDQDIAAGREHLVDAHIGGHAPCTIPDEGMEMMADAVKSTKRGLHLHVAEDRYDVSQSHLVYSRDIVKRLDSFGMLNDKTILVHGIYLNLEEIEILNSYDGFLVHNARSNMNNNVGYNENLSLYKNLALGTDGIGPNMYEEIKVAYFKHKDAGGPLWPGDYLQFLSNGNRILERNFGSKFGRLEKGYKADLVVADYLSPSPLVEENIGGHMVFGMTSTDVETVLINGKIVMENREFPFDVKEIYAKAAIAAKRVWENMDKIK
ncbi:MAG: putative aminohydrolase SsnA, partial [Spirochaetes bacterium]